MKPMALIAAELAKVDLTLEGTAAEARLGIGVVIST
ncbi:hypothetical protein amrb99_94270 [Actinomadura sp. RB99]|nr:hypothetical protein [Actinomadura sp. RB99]